MLARSKIAQWTRAGMLDAQGRTPKNYGYQDNHAGRRPHPHRRLEELVRWRLWDRTGGGLMAELGSHQLDAAGIFVSALRKTARKPLRSPFTRVGGRHAVPARSRLRGSRLLHVRVPRPELRAEIRPVGYNDEHSNYPNPKKGIPAYDRIRTRRSSSPTRRSTATASAATAKS